MKSALLLLLLTASAKAQEPTPKFPIGGTVVNASTGEHLENVQVVIALSDRQDRPLFSATTKGDGRFQFLVPKGNYSLYAERNGLGRQPYGSRKLGDFYGVSLIADGSQPYDNLVFRLFPPSAISGRVMDQHGEPVENALVGVLRNTIIAGRMKLVPRGYSYTTDQGEYRLGNLPSGQYFLVVGGTPWHSRESAYQQDRQPTGAAYVPVYFPNTHNPNAAAPLTLRPNEEARADFTLAEREGVPIRVKISGPLNSGARINLTAAGVAGLNRYQHVGTFYGGENYHIAAVPPGSYEVTVNGQNKGQFVSGSTTIESVEANREVTVTVAPPPSVSGKVTCDGKPAPAGNPIMVVLRNDARNQAPGRRLEKDSSFQIPGVAAGPTTVMLTGAPECFAGRVLLGGKEVKDRVITVGTTDITDLAIEGRGGMGEVKGFVRRKEAPAPSVFVYLAPAKETPDPTEYPTYKTDSDGSFHFKWVRPGEYSIYAVDEDDFEYMNPATIAPYIKRAEKVVVPSHGKLEKDVQLIDR